MEVDKYIPLRKNAHEVPNDNLVNSLGVFLAIPVFPIMFRDFYYMRRPLVSKATAYLTSTFLIPENHIYDKRLLGHYYSE